MANGIKPEDLGAAIEKQLTLYHEGVTEKVTAAGRKSIKKLVKVTQETAPIGNRRGGNFATSITSKEIKTARNVAMRIIRDMTSLSLPKIGALMGCSSMATPRGAAVGSRATRSCTTP